MGYHSFNNDTNDESPDYVASDIVSSIAKLGRPGNALGGSNDLTFGTATFSELTPGTNDGYLRVFEEGQPILTVTNNQSAALPLATLFFDAASQNTGSQVAVSYSINGDPTWVNLFTSPNLTNSGSSDASVNYDDFSINLSSIVLATGDSIQFQFTNPTGGGVRLDNIALTAIPEPANAMALALLLTTGVMLRNRRRKA